MSKLSKYMVVNGYESLLKYVSDNQLFISVCNDDYIPNESELYSLIGFTENYGCYQIGDTVYLYKFEKP